MWLCWVLFCRDMEMRCDEAVLEELGEGVKADYSLALVDFALNRRMPAALAFGEHDASRRVKNVLKWKKAAPWLAAVLAVLVVVVLVVCGTGALEQGSRVKPLDRETWQYRLDGTCQSALLYQEVYLDGQLTERDLLNTWSVDGENRKGTVALRPEWTDTAFRWSWNGEALEAVTMPELQGAVTLWAAPDEKTDLGGETILAAAAVNGSSSIHAFELQSRPGSWMADLKENRMAVVLRLWLSDLERSELESRWAAQSGDLAQVLFDLRGDPEALLAQMGAGTLGHYEVDWVPSGEHWALRLRFDRALDEAEDLWVGNMVYLLLALVPEADRVDYACPTETGSSTIKIYADSDPLDNWCRSLGYEGVRDLGGSAQGIRELMAYLAWQPASSGEGSVDVPFAGILGYQGYIRAQGDFWKQWTYYAVEGEETFPIAEAFGFTDVPEAWSVDLDGDGQEELVVNVAYGGDGHQEAYVYQRRADGIWRGSLEPGDLPNHDNWGVNSTMTAYDPAEGVFRVRYAQKGTEEPGEAAFRGLDRFQFQRFEPSGTE